MQLTPRTHSTFLFDNPARQIVLFRHGPAGPRAAPADDARRHLTFAGRRKVRRAARGMRSHIAAVHLIVSSPLPRAVETARIILELYRPTHGLVELEDLRPGGCVHRLAAYLRNLRMRSILVVGHEPDLSRLARRIIGSDVDDGLHLRKGGACLLELGSAPPHRARLRWVRSAYELASTA